MKSVAALALLAAPLLACGEDALERRPAPSSGTAGAPQAGASGSTGAAGTSVGAAAGSTGVGQAGQGGSGGSAGAAGGSGGSSGSEPSSNGYCGERQGLLFCEDFEDLPEGAVAAPAPWAAEVNGDGLVLVDSSASHSGDRALKVTGTGFSTFLVFHDPAILPAPGGRFFVRAFLRLAEPMSGGHNTFIIADLAEAPGTGNAVRLGEMNQMLMYTVSGDTHGALSNENYYSDMLPGAQLASGGYSCLEFLLDSSKPEIAVWLDGVEVPDLRHEDWPLDTYDALRFGFEKYAGPVRDIWYDDIAIGTEPIGCD